MYKKQTEKKINPILFIAVIAGVTALFTVYSDYTTKSARDAATLCAVSIIPSLFPFMVLSSVASRIMPQGNDQSPKISIILSVLMGMLCGFPIGVLSVAQAYKSGAIDKDYAEHLCALCNNTSPAFAIGVIGEFWGNKTLGLLFYICQILASSIIFCLWRIIFRKRKTIDWNSSEKSFSTNTENTDKPLSRLKFSEITSAFCHCVSESATNIIVICGYIIFFKVLCDTVFHIIPSQDNFSVMYPFISSLLEFTAGAKSSSILGGKIGLSLCAFAITFSGISVMAQSTGILTKAGLSAKSLFKMKLISGILSAILIHPASVFISFYSPIPASSGMGNTNNLMISVTLCIIALALICYFVNSIENRR